MRYITQILYKGGGKNESGSVNGVSVPHGN